MRTNGGNELVREAHETHAERKANGNFSRNAWSAHYLELWLRCGSAPRVIVFLQNALYMTANSDSGSRNSRKKIEWVFGGRGKLPGHKMSNIQMPLLFIDDDDYEKGVPFLLSTRKLVVFTFPYEKQNYCKFAYAQTRTEHECDESDCEGDECQYNANCAWCTQILSKEVHIFCLSKGDLDFSVCSECFQDNESDLRSEGGWKVDGESVAEEESAKEESSKEESE